MADNIYDFDKKPKPTEREEPAQRSRKREGLSSTDLTAGKRKLSEMVDRAFACLEEAMIKADFTTAIKAAQIILDRSGFGPKTTVDVNQTTVDLSSLTREQLAERASKLATMIKKQREVTENQPPDKTVH